MTHLLFVCHGNICRSPMAQSVMSFMVKAAGRERDFVIDSAAVSAEELGNPVHPGTRRVLDAYGVPCLSHRATRLTKADYETYDYLIGMDDANVRGMRRLLIDDPKGKIVRLLDFTDCPRDIADPWYTGDFEATYEDVTAGCAALLRFLTAIS